MTYGSVIQAQRNAGEPWIAYPRQSWRFMPVEIIRHPGFHLIRKGLDKSYTSLTTKRRRPSILRNRATAEDRRGASNVLRPLHSVTEESLNDSDPSFQHSHWRKEFSCLNKSSNSNI